jgi:hypothetical protein
MVSADIQTLTKDRARSLGVTAILRKPVRAESVKNAVAAAMAGQSWWDKPEGR